MTAIVNAQPEATAVDLGHHAWQNVPAGRPVTEACHSIQHRIGVAAVHIYHVEDDYVTPPRHYHIPGRSTRKGLSRLSESLRAVCNDRGGRSNTTFRSVTLFVRFNLVLTAARAHDNLARNVCDPSPFSRHRPAVDIGVPSPC